MMAFTITGTGALESVQAASRPGEASVVVLAAPQQAPQAAPGPGAVAGGSVLVLLLLGFYLHNQIKHKKQKLPPVLASFVAGTLLAGSVLGVLSTQAAATAGTSLTTLMTTVTGGSGTGTGTGTGTGR
jgi:FtsH-binding integral membrane protein